MHARIYDFTLTSGGMQRLPVVGDFFKVISATGVINVNVDTGATLDLMPGQGLREFNFNTLTITDKSGADNSGKILVGFSGMIDDRVTGEVSVIDGGRSTTLSNAAFSGGTLIGAAAGLYSVVQLWNPAASGKRVLISRSFAGAGAACLLYSRAATEAVGAALPGEISSKLVGGAAPAAELRRSNAEAGIGGVATLGRSYAPAGANNNLDFREPIVLRPGYGLSVYADTVNVAVAASFEFTEETV